MKVKYYNLDYLKEHTYGDKKSLMEMLQIFLKQTPLLIKRMSDSMDKKDWDGLYSASHNIITSLRMVGLPDEYLKMIKKIMDYSFKKEHLEELPEMVATIVNICNEICKELEEEYQALKKSLE